MVNLVCHTSRVPLLMAGVFFMAEGCDFSAERLSSEEDTTDALVLMNASPLAGSMQAQGE
jgi:hypothetical protein